MVAARQRPPDAPSEALVGGPGVRPGAGGIVPAVESMDAVLAARLAAGDDQALGEIWSRYGGLVVGCARRLTGDLSAAEDVAQEVFVALWEHPERFDSSRGSLRAFLGMHAQSRAIDRIRRDSTRSSREERHDRLDPASRRNHDETPDALTLAAVVRNAIAALPCEQREAVELAYYDGLTQKEVAERLGIPEGTAKSRLRLA